MVIVSYTHSYTPFTHTVLLGNFHSLHSTQEFVFDLSARTLSL